MMMMMMMMMMLIIIIIMIIIIITDRTAHNSRPDRGVLDKIIKESYSVGLAIPKSQPSQHHHRKASEV
jgi:uncharacterized membrane protein